MAWTVRPSRTTGEGKMASRHSKLSARDSKTKCVEADQSDASSLGVTVDNFPNFFFLDGPQAPTALCNASSCAEVQGGWIARTVDWLRQRGITKFHPTAQATGVFKDHVQELSKVTLLPKVASFWTGANIPGKRVEAYNYFGGLKKYKEALGEEADRGYPGFLRDALRQTQVA